MTVVYKISRETLDGAFIETAVDEFKDGYLSCTKFDGRTLTVPTETISLRALKALSKKVPDLFTIVPPAVNRVSVKTKVEQLLPLLFKGGDGEKPGEDSIPDSLKEIYWAMDDFGGPIGWLLEVNKEPWGSWDDKLFLPAIYPDDLFDEQWCSMGFTETASMTSGNDWCAIGSLNKYVGLERMHIDETAVELRVFEIVVPAEHCFEWLHSNLLLDQMWFGGDTGTGNGTLANAAMETFINDQVQDYFPSLGVIRWSDDQEARNTPGTQVESVFDHEGTAEFQVGVPDPQSSLGKKLLKLLRQAHPGWPVYQLIQSPQKAPAVATTKPTQGQVIEPALAYEDMPLQLKLANIDYEIALGNFELCETRLTELRAEPQFQSDIWQLPILTRLIRLQRAQGFQDKVDFNQTWIDDMRKRLEH